MKYNFQSDNEINQYSMFDIYRSIFTIFYIEEPRTEHLKLSK